MVGEPGRPATERYLDLIGVRPSPRATCPFDPGYDPVTVESHLQQSAHLIATLKISMACWIVADEGATRRKIAAASRLGVKTVAGGGPFETAVAQGALPAYLDLCADVGLSRIECGEGFTDLPIAPEEIVRQANERGLDVEFELGEKHSGSFTDTEAQALIELGRRWLDAGAVRLVVEARESAQDVGLFSAEGEFDAALAERFAEAFGLDTVLFEAPNKASQFAMINHFGPSVQLGNVRLEEVLRVEIYRRGLHSDAFRHANLRPRAPQTGSG
ncbi:MAG: phosphosulfolactate synthase [Solirubrobacterales bacterium]|jgi:phosphosulfolactate synthase|nr:phosphosulfolactate synthase [Solirubrobacterales bacterium]